MRQDMVKALKIKGKKKWKNSHQSKLEECK